METPFLDRLIEDLQDHIEFLKDAESYEAIPEIVEELAEYEAIKKAVAMSDIVFSESELKAKLEEQKEEIRQWLIDEDFEGLAERL